MSVYVELVIFNNFAVDLFIALSTLAIRRKRVGKLRLFGVAVVGSTVATLYAIAPRWGQILVKILLAPLLCAMLTKYEGVSVKDKVADYAKTLVCFCLVTYFVGGIVYGILAAFKADISSYPVLGIVCLACVICLRCALSIAKKRSESGKRVVGVVVSVDGEKIELKGLCDSGNLLTDDLSGLPVIMLSKSACDKIGKRQIEGFVTAHTVTGEKCMPYVKFDSVQVGQKCQNALGALCDCQFDDFDVILQNSMF